MAEEVKDRPGPWRGERAGPAAREAGRAGTDALRSTAADMRQQAAGVAEHAKEQGKATLARQKDTAADEVESVAGALHESALRLSESGGDSAVAPKIGRYVSYAAQQLEGFGRQLRGKDLDTLIDDAARLGRRSPATLFAGSLAVGFLLSRFLKASSARAPHEYRGAQQDAYGSEGSSTEGIGTERFGTEHFGTDDFGTEGVSTGSSGIGTGLQAEPPASSFTDRDSDFTRTTGSSRPSVLTSPVTEVVPGKTGDNHGQ
jgi:hypothetical protein